MTVKVISIDSSLQEVSTLFVKSKRNAGSLAELCFYIGENHPSPVSRYIVAAFLIYTCSLLVSIVWPPVCHDEDVKMEFDNERQQSC